MFAWWKLWLESKLTIIAHLRPLLYHVSFHWQKWVTRLSPKSVVWEKYILPPWKWCVVTCCQTQLNEWTTKNIWNLAILPPQCRVLTSGPLGNSSSGVFPEIAPHSHPCSFLWDSIDASEHSSIPALVKLARLQFFGLLLVLQRRSQFWLYVETISLTCFFVAFVITIIDNGLPQKTLPVCLIVN